MNEFEGLLNPGEQIIETIKPHKVRYLIFRLIGSLIVPIIAIIICLVIKFADIELTDGETGEIIEVGIGPFIIAAFFALIGIVAVISTFISYKKTLYAYTNQRVLFRTGFIGNDFQFLDYKNIQGINIYVDLPDKFFNPNTGTIFFLSSAMPMMMMNAQATRSRDNGYAFRRIPNAYAVYQKINEAFNASKQAQ